MEVYFFSSVFFREVITMFEEVVLLLIVLNFETFEFFLRLICFKITILFSLYS